VIELRREDTYTLEVYYQCGLYIINKTMVHEIIMGHM
jgi:hypothetical protein